MMYDTFYTTNLTLLKNRFIKPTFLRFQKKKKGSKKKPKAENLSTIVIQFMIRNFLEFKNKKQYS